jgi:Ras-related protein Rab-7A
MYKVLVVGDPNTGKTSLVNQFVQRKFEPIYKPTIACDFALKILEIAGKTVRVQIWDIGGQNSSSTLIFTKIFIIQILVY